MIEWSRKQEPQVFQLPIDYSVKAATMLGLRDEGSLLYMQTLNPAAWIAWETLGEDGKSRVTCVRPSDSTEGGCGSFHCGNFHINTCC